MIQKLQKVINENTDKVFYINDNDKLTYNELWAKSNELAKALINQGNSPVIIFGDKSIDMIISIVGCLIAKRAYVPIGFCTPNERLKQIVRLTNSSLLINNSEHKLENVETEVLNINEIYKKYNQNKIYYNESNSNDIAYIIFTSGSTGIPKGVPITYSNLNNFIDWISNFEILKDYKNINILNQASFSFDLSVADFYYSLFNGHTLVGLSSQKQDDLNYILNVIKENDINCLVITPTFAKFLLLNSDFNANNYPTLNCIYFCGELLDIQTVKKLKSRFNNIEIINAYGPTEATSAVSAVVINSDMLEMEYLPVGEIGTSAVDIEIIDNEIVLKGKSVFSGYLNINSNKCYKENNINCFKTNDLGYYKNNYLFCRGRMDNQIKYSGYRIELGDIENNLLKIDEVSEAVVIAKRNKDNNVKFIKAFITSDKKLDINYIKSKLKTMIPDYMIPKSIEQIDKMPISCNKKYDRKKLEDL